MSKRMVRLVAVLAALVIAIGGLGIASAKEDPPSVIRSEAAKGRLVKLYTDTDHIRIDLGRALRACFSSDPSVAKLSVGGRLRTGKAGLARIDVYRLARKGRHETFYVMVANKQVLTPEKKAYSLTYDGEPLQLKVATNSKEGNAIRFKSSDEDIITVSSSGKIRAQHAGSAYVKVKASASKSYYGAEIKVPVTVDKKEPNLKIKQKNIEIPVTKKGEKIRVSSDSKGKLAYKSSDEGVVKIKKNGTIVPKGEGTAKVTVVQRESNNYTKTTASVEITVTKPTATDYAMAAVEWARMIANDDSFTYGTGHTAHSAGCYFCGTNQRKKGGGRYTKTYCCNPFVFAAYAHGAQIPAFLNGCRGGACGGMLPSDWTKYGMTYLGTTKQVKAEELLPGDVIMSDGSSNGWYNHVWMVCDNNQYVEAGREGWDAGSIAVHNDAMKNYASYAAHGSCYVVRYIID